MQLHYQDGILYLRNPDPAMREYIKSMWCFRWDSQNKWWVGYISREMLVQLSRKIKLPAELANIKKRMEKIQRAVDEWRTKPDGEVELSVDVPVKAELYTHQKRAIQMCLLHFGIIEP